MTVPILSPRQEWYCPNCDVTDVTPPLPNRFHACRGLRGLTAPMIPAGTRAKVEARERDDYVGDELVQYDGEGRAMMSVITTRDDGEDCVVLAPTARGSFHAD